MYNELLDFVDENDNFLWVREKYEIYSQKLIYRVCHVMVVNSIWKIAIQKRSTKVSYMPWAWSTSAWWHVSSGDTYENSANRELKEEIWISWNLVFIDKVMYTLENNHSKFSAIFELKYDWEFNCEDGEVEIVEWFSIDEIKSMRNWWEIFHPELLYILENYYY